MAKNPDIKDIIATAIQQADKSYFFEDYTKQSTAVLKALNKAGYDIIPTKLPEDLAQNVAKNMRTGRVKPEDHVRNLIETAFKELKKLK
jgi:hypothetical protein